MRALHIVTLTAFLPVAACFGGDAGGATAADAAATDAVALPDSVIEAAAAGISPEDFARRVGVLAHDSMRGRATPSPELEATAVWIGGELETMGVEPGTEDGYVQRYSVALGAGGETLEAPNVVGVLRGSDPVLSSEYVLFSAHMDHVGVGLPDAHGDSIFNGADDDASGTTAVLEIAEAFAQLEPAPRRSLVFLWVSGEERGLWGSQYYAENPTVPIENVVANLNMDMVGRNWSDTIVAIGKEHSDLGETLHQVAARHAELDMEPIDDLWPAESFYTRSDHFNFAKKGVPVLFFFNGTHEDYHRPSDEADKIDADKAARVARLVFFLGLEIASRDARPVWDPESLEMVQRLSR